MQVSSNAVVTYLKGIGEDKNVREKEYFQSRNPAGHKVRISIQFFFVYQDLKRHHYYYLLVVFAYSSFLYLVLFSVVQICQPATVSYHLIISSIDLLFQNVDLFVNILKIKVDFSFFQLDKISFVMFIFCFFFFLLLLLFMLLYKKKQKNENKKK